MTERFYISCYVLRHETDHWSILQALRRPGVYMAESWQTISGSIEDGESASAAALRELKEETSLSPIQYFRLPSVIPFYIPQYDVLGHSICFAAIVDAHSIPVLNEEHTRYRWIPLAEAESDFMWPADTRAIEEIRRFVIADGLCSPFLQLPLDVGQESPK